MSVDGVVRLARAEVPQETDWRRWAKLTGTLDLMFQTRPGRWVSPGTGRIEMFGPTGAERLVLAAARRSGRPVLPGSGIKGAVRTIFELITASCNPFDEPGLCGACAACSLFGCIGARGHRGRLGFDDATGSDAEACTEKVPIPFPPHADKTPGDVRLYDQKPKDEAERVLSREAYRGRFEGRIAFDSASDVEMGLVLLSLGLGSDELRFPLRVGGVRYDGQGAVEVTLASAWLAAGALTRRTLDGDEIERTQRDWIGAGLRSLDADRLGTLERVAEILRRES